MRRTLIGAVLALSLVAVPNALAATKHYYLALGDSLSVGYQPTGADHAGIETKQGYTNDLLAKYSKSVKRLTLKDVGCPGDTTTSLLTGKGNDTAATTFHCDRKGGSQLAAAVRFLKAHHHTGEVPLITIDIGANDVDGCVNEPSYAQVLECVSAGEKSIKTNTPKILTALHRAAPKKTKFTAMNLYDPILALELSSNSNQQQLGRESLNLAESVDSDIAAAGPSRHFKTANVFKAFDTADTTKQTYEGQSIPTDVVRICQLTWMCSQSNIHANQTGYRLIAGAFEKVIGKLR